MMRWGTWRRFTATTLTIVLTVSLLAACSFGKNNANEGDQERVLRIAYSGGYTSSYGDWLRTQYTEIFEWVNPNIKVEFIENMDTSGNYNYMRSNSSQETTKTPMELLNEELDGSNPPDVIIMEYGDMKQLVRDNRLTPLDPLMTKSKMNTEEYVPSVIEALKKNAEDGKIYGLSPLFSSSVLGYNKKLFTDSGLAYPTDGMTWDEVFNLARQVSKGEGSDRTYGFSFSNYRYNDMFYDMNTYAAPLDLRIWDEKGEKMMVNTPEWVKVWQTIYELKKEKIFPEQPDWSQPQPEQQNPFEYNSMLSGKVGMMILNYWDLTEIINTNRNAANIENFNEVDWDIVSVPYHESAPNVGGYVNLSGIMGVTSNAQNPDDAWAFIEFIMSEKWAQSKSKSAQQLVTWKKYNEPLNGLDYNMEAFFVNTPATNNMDYNDLWRTKPDISQAQWIGQTKFQEVVNGDKTVEEALKEWETEGDAILQRLMDNNGTLGEDYWNNLYNGNGTDSISVEKMRVMEAAGELPPGSVEEATDEFVEESADETVTDEAVAEGATE
jgi:multiple sugar transport system substrate-binding protein